jgi:hypothetical protein
MTFLWRLLSCAILFALVMTWLTSLMWPVHAQEHHHPGQTEAVDRFYSTWFMPDEPTKSCCNKADCYPTSARFQNGQWWAQRREDHEWLPIPWNKVEQNRDNPDGRSHLCAPAPNTAAYPPLTVFCFSLGGGT